MRCFKIASRSLSCSVHITDQLPWYREIPWQRTHFMAVTFGSQCHNLKALGLKTWGFFVPENFFKINCKSACVTCNAVLYLHHTNANRGTQNEHSRHQPNDQTNKPSCRSYWANSPRSNGKTFCKRSVDVVFDQPVQLTNLPRKGPYLENP